MKKMKSSVEKAEVKEGRVQVTERRKERKL